MYKGYIYRHWLINDKENEISYIGQVYNRAPQKRWGKNGKGYKPQKDSESTKFYNAIKKYGWDNFKHEVVLTIECETKEELWFWLDEWEKYYIEKYDSFHNGYNSTTGGSSGKPGEETRKKQSKARKGKPLSEEHKQHIGEAMTGMVFSKERNLKISSTLKGKPLSEERKRNISKSRKGQPSAFKGKRQPEEAKQRISDSLKGRKLSEETKAKLSENSFNATKVICLETLQVFDTIDKAQKWCNIKTGVGKCCRGKAKSAGKHPITKQPLHWMYYDEYLKLQEGQQNSDNLDSTTNVA